MSTFIEPKTGRKRTVNDTPKDQPQNFDVYVNHEDDWEEIHNFIINENEIDDIPNRRISCTSEMRCSKKRSVYNMSEEEAKILRQHPKVRLVIESALFNSYALEKRIVDEELDKVTQSDRFNDREHQFFREYITDSRREYFSGLPEPRITVRGSSGVRIPINFDDFPIGIGNTFAQAGLVRHQCQKNPFTYEAQLKRKERRGEPQQITKLGGVGNQGLYGNVLHRDVNFSLTGKNVDVVIFDTGVAWNNPEFLLPGVLQRDDINPETNLPGNMLDFDPAAASFTRVRDIIIHGESEYGIDWEAEGLVPPGVGSLRQYSIANVLSVSNINYGPHGTHVASTAAGNENGWAREANIWSIAAVDTPFFAEPSTGFDYIKVWHKNKPINPKTGRKNPTVVNCSWGHRQFFYNATANDPNGTTYVPGQSGYKVRWRGVEYTSDFVLDNENNLPAVDQMPRATPAIGQGDAVNGYTAERFSGQLICDEFFDDPECDDVTVVCAAGNTPNKMDRPGEPDHENELIAGKVLFDATNYSLFLNRAGTPAITHQGKDDAAIVVSSISVSQMGYVLNIAGEDRYFHTPVHGSEGQGEDGMEMCSWWSSRGSASDLLACGEQIMGAFIKGINIFYSICRDRRNINFTLAQLSGTSMATPQVTGVIAQHLQSRPNSTRAEVRKWLLTHGVYHPKNTEFYDGNSWGGGFLGPTTDLVNPDDAVGQFAYSYWFLTSRTLRGTPRRILFNPYANNSRPIIKGVNIKGVKIKS